MYIYEIIKEKERTYKMEFGAIGAALEKYSFPLLGEDKSKNIPEAGGGYIAFNATPNPQDEMRLNKKLAEKNPMVAAGLTNVS